MIFIIILFHVIHVQLREQLNAQTQVQKDFHDVTEKLAALQNEVAVAYFEYRSGNGTLV